MPDQSRSVRREPSAAGDGSVRARPAEEFGLQFGMHGLVEVDTEGNRRLVGINRARVSSHGERLEDIFADAITLADSDELRTLKREVLGDA